MQDDANYYSRRLIVRHALRDVCTSDFRVENAFRNSGQEYSGLSHGSNFLKEYTIPRTKSFL